MKSDDDPQEVESASGGKYSIDNNGRSRFSAAKMGRELSDRTPFAKTPAGELWVYRKGRYEPDGEDSIKRRVTSLMGDVWVPKHSNDTIEWIRSRASTFEEAPQKDIVIVKNGIVRVTSKGVTFTEGDAPELLTPVSLPVTYDPKAKAAVFVKFLQSSLDDEALIQMIQEWCGYVCVPDNDQQKALLSQGIEGAGKSKLVSAVVEMLGRRNCASHDLRSLNQNRFAGYDLYGKLLNATADISSQELSSSQMFRQITGGDDIWGERKHQQGFPFKPFARLMFSVNKFPTFRDPTNAVFDRWLVAPWTRKFRGTAKENKKLLDQLTTPAALSGLLNWSLDGLVRLRKQGGFTEAPKAVAALELFRQSSDIVRIFITDCKHTGKLVVGRRVERTALFHKYIGWCAETEHTAMGRNNFYDRVAAVLGAPGKSSGEWYFRVR